MTDSYDYPPEVLGDHPGEPEPWGLTDDDEGDD